MNRPDRPRVAPRLILGIGVVLVGVVFLLDNLGFAEAGEFLRYWPVVLIAIGITRLGGPTTAPNLIIAACWIGFGTWFLLEELDVIRASPWEFFWPLVLIAAGLGLAFGAAGRRPAGGDPASTVNAFAFFSGLERRSTSADFRSADLVAVCGGCDLDLTHSQVSSGEVVVSVFAFWGGVEISVPRGWTVETSVLPLLGGFEDKTRQESAEGAPRLIVKGTVIMGGGELKN